MCTVVMLKNDKQVFRRKDVPFEMKRTVVLEALPNGTSCIFVDMAALSLAISRLRS